MPKTVNALKVSLPLTKASEIVDAALAAARTHELEPLTVVVLDTGGHDVALKREDGSGIIRVEIARAKAYGALGMGLSSRGIGERLGQRPIFASSLTVISGGRLAVAAGGVLIKDGAGEVIGAVGISGDTSEKDELAAIKGIEAAGLMAEPREPDPRWNG
ncbi:MAG TPA: heme-binding protein [Gammaproteobacteria bacterium]|nr:heme-binding protein [Gammaproteobacteria bacterium]